MTRHTPPEPSQPRAPVDAADAARDAAIAAFDRALRATGDVAELVHHPEPLHGLALDQGGPAVFCLTEAAVRGRFEHTLLVTYGLSGAVSLDPGRRHIRHEYSIAAPAGEPLIERGAPLLRHFARKLLESGSELKVGDVEPCYRPISELGRTRDELGRAPSTGLTGLVVAPDPLLPRVVTPNAHVEVRRLIGLWRDEIDRAETWSGAGFADELRRLDPTLSTPFARESSIRNEEFLARVNARAMVDGSSIPAISVMCALVQDEIENYLALPQGSDGDKLSRALIGRLRFGRTLTVFPLNGDWIRFSLTDEAGIEEADGGVRLALDKAQLEAVLAALAADQLGVRIS